MPRAEITSTNKYPIALNIQTISSNTTTVGNPTPTADFNGGVDIVIQLGARTDGTYTPLIEDSLDGTTYLPVEDTFLVPQNQRSTVAPETQAILNTSNTTSKIGYVGIKPYLRTSIVSTSVTTGSTIGAIYVKKSDFLDVV